MSKNNLGKVCDSFGHWFVSEMLFVPTIFCILPQHLDIFMLFNSLLSEGSKMACCFIYIDVHLQFLFERSFILFHVYYILMVDKMEKIYTFIKRIFLN